MITLLEHRTTLTYLAYLGYPDEPRTGALLITRPRKYDRRRGDSSRNVFLCYVCGAAGSGKTSLLRSFAGKQFDDTYVPTEKVLSVVNSVDIHGSEKYLVVGWGYVVKCFFLDTHFLVTRIWFKIRARSASKFQEDRPG